MDEDEFDESLDKPSAGNASDIQPLKPVLEDSPRHSPPRRVGSRDTQLRGAMADQSISRPEIVWVRASDLLSTGTRRIASRGVSIETDLSRRMKRAPTAARRALRTRVERLPPLTEFGRSTGNPPLFWYRLLRH